MRRREHDLLAEVPLFEHMSPTDLRHVAALTTRLRLPAGRELISEGETGRELIIILEGEVEVRHGDAVVATHGPGSFVGEISLLLDRPRTATVVARTDVVVDVIDRQEFRDLLASHPELYEPLLHALAVRLDRDHSA